MNFSLKYKLLGWFISFSVLILIVIGVLNGRYYRKREQNLRLISEFINLQTSLLKIFNTSNSFFSTEVRNPNFFEEGNSFYISKIDSSIRQVIFNLENTKDKHILDKDINLELDSLRLKIIEFNRSFGEIVILINERGYKDYGLEGSMRNQVHKLEYIPLIDQARVLMLRRHEKDYIIRGENQYVEKLHRLSEKFRNEILLSTKMDNIQKDSVLQIIESYVGLFDHIVQIDSQIGLRNNTASKKRLDLLQNSIGSMIDFLISRVEMHSTREIRRARITFFTEVILVLIANVFISLWISRIIAGPLIRLTQCLSEFTSTDLKSIDYSSNTQSYSEISMLNYEFNRMINRIVTREKQRDQALIEQKSIEDRYHKMADLLPLSLFETAPDGNFVYINKLFEETFECRQEEWKSLYLNDILTDTEMLESRSDLLDPFSFETKAKTKTGGEFPALVYCCSKSESNQISGLRGVILDISERVKTLEEMRTARQKAEESDRLKSAFLANMSHEIRTPMNSVIGFTDLLSELVAGDSTASEYVRHVKDSGNLLLKIINDIIDLSIIEAGRLKIRTEVFELNNFLEEIYRYFRNKADNDVRRIQILLEKDSDDQVFIESDPYRLKQILINLISNALKFTQQGQITIGYRIETVYIRFFVSDTGIGIAEDKLQVIFERFRQADETSSRKYGGTGLGLAISKNLVELLGGTIYAESKIDQGSVFYFSLPGPNIRIRPGSDENVKSVALDSNFDWSDYTVLIVEDDESSLKYLTEAMKQTGIQIIHSSNGRDCIKVVMQNMEIDIILMDINLPFIDGYEATSKIRAMNSSIPIIAQTAYAMSDEKILCIEAGCSDYISKPINKTELLLKMAYYLKAPSKKSATGINPFPSAYSVIPGGGKYSEPRRV